MPENLRHIIINQNQTHMKIIVRFFPVLYLQNRLQNQCKYCTYAIHKHFIQIFSTHVSSKN